MKLDRRLLAWARSVRGLLALTVALGLAAGVFTVFQARYLSATISAVFLGGAGLAETQPVLIALLLAGFGRAAALWGSEAAAGRAAARVKNDVRDRLLLHIQQLGPAYTARERTGELVNTAVEGVEALDAYFSQYLPGLALAGLVPLTFLLIVFPLDLVSALVLLLTAPLIPIFMVLIGSLADGLTRRQWTSLSRMSAHFLDVLQGLATLKLFGRSRQQIETIRFVGDRFRASTMGVLRVTFLSALVLEMVATISTAIVAVEIGLRLLYGRMAFEQAFFVLILAPEFYLPLRLLGQRFHAGMAGVAAARRICEVLELGGGVEGWRSEGAPSLLHPSTPPLILFENVHFAYDSGRRPALRGVSFALVPGQMTALIGPTGSGKSTVAQLLLRFIEPQAGEITVDGAPLGRWPADEWRRLVAWVPQSPYLFYGTAADNIRLGRPDAGMEEVVRAARQAQIHDFINTLPDGYETQIGERGQRLSGGQAQRLALARAFLKDAPIIILDEATTNLDPESEALVQEAAGRLLAGRTSLVITHRLNTVTGPGGAAQILVLREGRIEECGDQAALLARPSGLYRRLVTAFNQSGGPLAGGSQSPRASIAAGDWRKSRAAGLETGDSAQSDWAQSEWAQSPIPLPGTFSNPAAQDFLQAPGPRRVSSAGSAAHPLLRLLRFALPLWPWIGLSALLGLAAVGSGIALLGASAWIIATAALQPSIAVLGVAIVAVRFFGITRGLFRYLERLVSHEVTFRLLAGFRVWFYARLEPLAPAVLDQYRSGDLLARIVADVGTLENFYVRAIAPPLVAVLGTAGLWVFFGSYDGRLALALLCALVAAGIGLPLLVRLLSSAPGRDLVAARGELNAALSATIQGLPDLLAFGAARAQLAGARALGARLSAIQARMAAIRGLHTGLASLFASLAVLAVLLLGVPLVAAGRLSGVDLAVLALVAAAAFEAVQPLPLAAQHLEASLEAGRRLFAVVDDGLETGESPAQRDWRLEIAEPSMSNLQSRCAGLSPITCPQSPILSVENLTLRYAPGLPPALDGVSFQVGEGECLTIVGASGAGKTTLLQALLRFREYQAGSVRLFGRDLRSYGGEEARGLIAVVDQRTHLFNATLRDNLLLARPEATQEEIEAAARVASIHDFIRGLPDGYDTWVGEAGLRLSGGERQRVSIARALLKNAPLLVLDEATANLDPLTEQAVLAAIRGLAAGRTTIMITHRLAGLDAADQVLVLDEGRVVERGTPAELRGRAGPYRLMWERQAQAAAIETL